ncbi:MAG: metal-dependent hydrolase [Candidatus Micrarchaeota archaeon]
MEYIYYMGHSTFEVLLSGKRILIDPFFGNMIRGKQRIVPSSGSVETITKADMILITHEHPDHFEKESVQRIVKKTNASVVGPRIVLSNLNVPDSLKVDVRIGDRFVLQGISIEVVKALHPQSQYPVGYLLEAGGKRIYHAGDTYEFAKMVDLKADWVMLPVGGSFTMDPLSAIKACKEIRPKNVVPMHYNTYDSIVQSITGFITAINETDTKPVVMKPGESIQI